MDTNKIIDNAINYLHFQKQNYGNFVYLEEENVKFKELKFEEMPKVENKNTIEEKTVIKEVPLTLANNNWKESNSLEVLNNNINQCLNCKLGSTRKNFVFGSGNSNADIMIIGEAPGADEDEQGLPFVGRAGQLLTQIIESIKLSRNDVYIANIIKCRPPGNRKPEKEEVEQCRPYLLKQIELINPKFLLLLGLTAVESLTGEKHKMNESRGETQNFMGRTMLITYHPAALLRNPNWKRPVWEDMKKLRAMYDEYLRMKG